MTTRIALAGAAGRMGQRIIALAQSDSEVKIVAAVDVARKPVTSGSAILISQDITVDFHVLVNFSSPAGTIRWLEHCEKASRPIVIGATGHTPEQLERIQQASKRIAVLKSANMSVGVNLLLNLVRQLSAALDDSYDIEITEAHHREKKDAPSGTALALKDAILEGRRARGTLSDVIMGRTGQSARRKPGEIGMHSLRLGDVVGEHSVLFAGDGETITLSHSAQSRDTFAAGAVRAAKWLTGKSAGLYTMADVLSATEH